MLSKTVARYSCPFCGSTDIIYDLKHGMLVCRNCGSVIEESLPQEHYPMPGSSAGYSELRRQLNSNSRVLKGFTFNALERQKIRLYIRRRLGFNLNSLIGSSDFSSNEYEALKTLAKNECVRVLLTREKDLRARRALILMLVDYLLSGVIPYASGFASEAGVSSRVLMRKFKKIINKCF